MTERRRIIEGTWECTSCGAKGIRGRERVCPACGSPRENEEMSFAFGETNADGSVQAATVEADEALEAARAGADWTCLSCDAENRGDLTHCARCGAAREAPPPEPPPPPAPPDEPPDIARAAGLAAGGGLGLLALLGSGGLGLVACCGGLIWLTAPVEGTASVASREYVREVTVQRLTATTQTGWRDVLPAEGSPPGAGAKLAPGRGAILGCETKACYPRPPDAGRLVRVTGRRWERTHTVRTMTREGKTGWRSAVPSRRGAWPVGGEGGTEGLDGAPSCSKKERTPERCRDVKKREQCGTEQKCTTKDLGNGFAEEVCRDVPKMCTVTKKTCDPAVFDDWCRWNELSWGRSRTEKTTGTMNAPYSPSLSAGPRDAITRKGTYTVLTETLAGSGEGPVSVTSGTLQSYALGSQYFTRGRSLTPVPAALVRRGSAVDCGTDIPKDTLISRDACRYEQWSWVSEEPRLARGANRPDWPAVDLRDDGEESRREWAELEMSWARGDTERSEALTVTVEEADAWPEGREVPVTVRFSGELDEKLGDWPTPRAAE